MVIWLAAGNRAAFSGVSPAVAFGGWRGEKDGSCPGGGSGEDGLVVVSGRRQESSLLIRGAKRDGGVGDLVRVQHARRVLERRFKSSPPGVK